MPQLAQDAVKVLPVLAEHLGARGVGLGVAIGGEGRDHIKALADKVLHLPEEPDVCGFGV